MGELRLLQLFCSNVKQKQKHAEQHFFLLHITSQHFGKHSHYDPRMMRCHKAIQYHSTMQEGAG
jgi:hypothetical protein